MTDTDTLTDVQADDSSVVRLLRDKLKAARKEAKAARQDVDELRVAAFEGWAHRLGLKGTQAKGAAKLHRDLDRDPTFDAFRETAFMYYDMSGRTPTGDGWEGFVPPEDEPDGS